ncbi:hypothetical protein A3C17_01850 [Candidatus Uhrbacteria bacterium RIFCSPHIGHO2_02_FULL_53_13]|uniref:Heat-inducible transcription repressor HrcA n=1 Tax=Candidatus Uhrbacteria bacterium RIFCSPHIGHO2_02_FULL_53_13 TaxID=1802389 RepID=A0A1F7U143_9BACT|nr:MAG: hypothetical protein A3C17_01850 [Candidatus Uhrbacteria bacterium RIFCSPHIGHO2_02_FULL_53_13]
MLRTLDERQSSILEATVREYIQSAEPVGSVVLAERYGIEASPATIRNDMVDLEQAGFLSQPHTSAGRVPTEQAYRYYIEHFLRERTVPRREATELNSALRPSGESRQRLKLTAKLVASFSDESVFVAFGPHDVYYTGIANLLNQPEFTNYQQLYSMGMVIDQLDEALARIHGSVADRVQVLVGDETHLSNLCSVIVTRWRASDIGEGVFGLLGPTRMDYDTNVARVKYVHEHLSVE